MQSSRGTVVALVFNFVDLMTHGRSESPILMEVAKDEVALRGLTRSWFARSTAFEVLKEAAHQGHRVILTTDHGSILCQRPTTLFARKDDFGAEFEDMYLDLLRAGGTRNAVELMAPFGLDPRDPAFWQRGIEASVARWLDDAEALSARMGVAVSHGGV